MELAQRPIQSEGDEVVIFGAEKPIEELAEALQTIPYEALTNISERVRREYFGL